MTRRLPAQREDHHLAMLRACTNCGVTTYPQSMPADLRPAHGKRYSAKGLCETCYHRQHRGRGLEFPVFAREKPCARCGITRTSLGHIDDALCHDCSDVTIDLNEAAHWSEPIGASA